MHAKISLTWYKDLDELQNGISLLSEVNSIAHNFVGVFIRRRFIVESFSGAQITILTDIISLQRSHKHNKPIREQKPNGRLKVEIIIMKETLKHLF